ncbi:1,3-beta-glucanosyltransferase gas1 [Tulasnella sp. 417]|nr:1,3-beta-glucanosyltransferase gas1 [Tulasnella sp. 417]
MHFLKAFATAATLIPIWVSALPKVTRTGRYLYQENGTRFYIKGVAYQEQRTVTAHGLIEFPDRTDYVDPLANANGCNRDLPYLKQLVVNTIRVYSVNSALNHDSCMQALSQAGIYVILDLALPVNGSIDGFSPTWTSNLLDLYIGTVHAFLKYDNVLAYNVGNRVVNSRTQTHSAPFIKAAARDVKAYLKSKGSSALVGYSSTDGGDGAGKHGWKTRLLADYLACDTDATSIDLYGLDVYRWCGEFGSISDYSPIISYFKDYPIPAYFSEFGCIISVPRRWNEVPVLFGEQMVNEWSGGVAFSYFPTGDDYGMVDISTDGSVTTTDDFTYLQTQYNAVSFINSPAQHAAGRNTHSKCPSNTDDLRASTTLPRTPTNDVCECLEKKAFGCVFSNTGSNNTSDIIDELFSYACSQIEGIGGCAQLSADGATGTYGLFSVCSPTTKLSYALSLYYAQSGSCNFDGNATVISTGPTNIDAAFNAMISCTTEYPIGIKVPADPTPTVPSTKGASHPTQPGDLISAAGFADARGTLITMIASVGGVAGGMFLLL